MSETLRIGIVGLGVGEAHLASYQALPDVEVRAICDIDPARLAEIGDRYDVRGRHTDWRAIIDDPATDTVSICSLDHFHAENEIRAERKGPN